MSPALHRLHRLLRRFGGDGQGVAAVEFALIFPLLIFLYFGSIEAAALFTVDKRINSLSSTVGDLVSQWDPGDGDLTTSTMNDYMAASTGILSPYPSAGLQIVVTLVKVGSSDGTTTVLWSKANAAGTAKTPGNSYSGLPASSAMNQLSRGGCVVAAEVSYSYLPMLAQVFKTALTLKHTTYFLPRFGSSEPIDLDTTSLSATACTA